MTGPKHSITATIEGNAIDNHKAGFHLNECTDSVEAAGG